MKNERIREESLLRFFIFYRNEEGQRMDAYIKSDIEIHPCCSLMEQAIQEGWIKVEDKGNYPRAIISIYKPDDETYRAPDEPEYWIHEWRQIDFCLFCDARVKVHKVQGQIDVVKEG
jgi:hypothetical protein